ncbi:hypothetical protein [Robbsia sp. KACC 23696]|uniref:hypothetical protein n=1 Tax=Robbsia sp. KACC 23696 TaxID=3149231 RepID=UPI00325A56D7
MEQALSIDNLSSTSSRPPSSGTDAVWMQERLTLRLTKARREALMAIASVEGRITPPVEAIDRAIELASLYLRGADASRVVMASAHTLSDMLSDFSRPADTLADIVADIPNPAGGMADIVSDIANPARTVADTMSDIPIQRRGAAPIHVRHLADVAGISRKMSNNDPKRLPAWLTLELERHGNSSATTAIILARRALDSRGDGLDTGRLQCRLVAIDGHGMGPPGSVDMANWPDYGEVVLSKPLQTKATAPISGGSAPYFLWAERRQGGKWLVHVHSIGDTGVGSAVAVFSMSDTELFGWQTLSAGTADN